MITLTTEYQAALESDAFIPCHLIDLPGPLTLTTAPNDLSFGGKTYVSSGITLALDGIASSTDISADTYTITLDNSDQTALGIYGNANYIGAEVVIYLGILNDDGTLLVNGSNEGPFEIYKGLFDTWAVQESTTNSVIKIKVKSHWAAFGRKAGRFTNSASQQEVYSTDTFFEYAHEDRKEIRWMTRT